MKTNLDRIISIATLLVAMVAIILVLKRPAPAPVVVMPQAPAAVSAPPQSSSQPVASPDQTSQSYTSGSIYRTTAPAAAGSASQTAPPVASNAKADPRINSDEISSAVAKMLGGSASASPLSPDSNVGSGEPTIKDQQVTMDGDIVHGKFLTTIAGKDVWVTISGHMGEKDGYATFDPTEFKVGDMNVPVSLVNPALQRKLSEERDRLKVPNSSN